MIAALHSGGRPLRFAIAGAANTAVGLGFYPFLLWMVPAFRSHYLIALGLAQIVCLCFAFTTYKVAVFRTRGRVVREFGAFSSFYLINYAANWAALPLLVEFANVSPVAAQSGFALLVILGSWFWHSRITFQTSGNGA